MSQYVTCHGGNVTLASPATQHPAPGAVRRCREQERCCAQDISLYPLKRQVREGKQLTRAARRKVRKCPFNMVAENGNFCDIKAGFPSLGLRCYRKRYVSLATPIKRETHHVKNVHYFGNPATMPRPKKTELKPEPA